MFQVGLHSPTHCIPRGPSLKSGRKRLRLKLEAESDHPGCLRRSRPGLPPRQGQAFALARGPFPAPQPAGASHVDRLHLTVAVAASRALSGLRMKCLFTSTMTHILSGQTVTPHLKMLFPFYLLTFQGMQFPSGKSPGPLLPSMKAVFKQE